MIKKSIKLLFEKIGLNVTKMSYETEVPAEELNRFLLDLKPQGVSELIRLGSKNDGGYVVPKNLGKVSKLFSPGCDGIVEFERDLFQIYQIPSIVLDDISKKPQPLDSFIHFQENWLDATTKKGTISLTDWVNQNSTPAEDLMLQMDIEGSEYEVIRNTSPEILDKFHTIVIEFHYFEMIKNAYLFETKIKPVFEALLRNHIPVFLNPNNCCGEVKYQEYRFPRVFEITLLRKSEAVPASENWLDEMSNYANIAGIAPISIKWEDFLGR